MTSGSTSVEQYMALALQPVMVGAKERADITRNLDHIAELAFAAKNVTEIELPVRLYTIPEGALQGFTDEIFDWDHLKVIDKLTIALQKFWIFRSNNRRIGTELVHCILLWFYVF